MTNLNYFLIDLVNLSCADTVRLFPIETQKLDTEITTKKLGSKNGLKLKKSKHKALEITIANRDKFTSIIHVCSEFNLKRDAFFNCSHILGRDIKKYTKPSKKMEVLETTELL